MSTPSGSNPESGSASDPFPTMPKTRVAPRSTGNPASSPPVSSRIADERAAERYREIEMLGLGGMGEVHSVRDELLGREVALKTLREDYAAAPLAAEQFEHEFKLQARLEHPSVVPVYDIGLTADGRTYFTMKKVRGTTLHEILEGIRAGEPVVSSNYPRRRLVEAVARATLAVDYAHMVGILHRDLKPANIMVGDFGEVYVLDWGIAVDTWYDAPPPEPIGDAEPDAAEPGWHEDHELAEGLSSLHSSQQVGTPGYAPPEQISGAVAKVSARSDVWSLGAILFEVLTGQPYVTGNTPAERILSTVDGDDSRFTVQPLMGDVPPELVAICRRALAYDPENRFLTAHELYQGLQRYLDGERDLELRAQLAIDHVVIAEAAVERALTAADESALVERAQAMKEIGRALALDPQSVRALRVLVRLLNEQPRHVPREVEAELAKGANELVRRGFQLGTYCYLSWIFCVPALMWMGLRDGWVLGLFMMVTLFAGAYSYVGGTEEVVTPRRQYGLLILTSLSLAVASRGFGPMVIVPTAIAVNMLSFSMSESRGRRVAFVVIGTGIGLVAPTILERCGILAPSYSFAEGVIRILPNAAEFPEIPTLTVLLFANLAIIVVAAFWGGICRDELNKRDLELLLRKWHLAQMLPDEPKSGE